MYRYETHAHTSPVSSCARATVREQLEFYKKLGYDGIFITNHFLDGNINLPEGLNYEQQIEYYFSDVNKGKELAPEIGIKVFEGVEISYKGTDFLIYGLDEEWYKANPQITKMKKKEELQFFIDNGALVIHAHPFRESSYIDHIRLFPRSVEGVETINANRTEFENKMADIYADNYGFVKTAGSDNHVGMAQNHLAGVCTETPIDDETDFMERIRTRKIKFFTLEQENGIIIEERII